MRLLLINPRFPESFWSFKWAMYRILPHKKTINPPLGLATLAALCPDDWEVTIVDENVESLPHAPQADIVGICGMGVQFRRQRELLTYYRARGYYVVAGGSYASLCPEHYESFADTVVAGEAEYIWPQFCRDFSAGKPRSLYRETGEVDLTDSPVPRFDLLRLHKYQAVSLQFSRGCPFRCEFCDIIVMFGRKPRTKPLVHVGRELDALRKLGVHNVFFVDDNLIGNKPMAHKLLAFLRDYQHEHNYDFSFGTEASLNLAHDEELLQRFRAANFAWVFIGIESPDEECLKETLKFQNTRQDILASVRNIYGHGIDILAGFIIGFDHDTLATFDRQYRFIINSGIQASMIGLLQALPKTPLHERLQREGRLIRDADGADNSKLGTNVIPQGMRYEDMLAGYRDLHVRLFSDRGIAMRIRNKSRWLRSPVPGNRYSVTEMLSILGRLVVYGICPGGFRRMMHFVGSIPWARPRRIPQAIEDWIVGLAMCDYIDRHLLEAEGPTRHNAQTYFNRLKTALQRYQEAGALEVSLHEVKQKAAEISLTLSGRLDRRFYNRAGRHLRKVLRDTRASVTLHIDHLQQAQVRHLHHLLRRLSRYGDRVRINVHEAVENSVQIDSSVFDVALKP